MMSQPNKQHAAQDASMTSAELDAQFVRLQQHQEDFLHWLEASKAKQQHPMAEKSHNQFKKIR